MKGLMQQTPLLVGSTLAHAAKFHRGAKIVSRRADGSLVEHGYADLAGRAARLGHALRALGIAAGDRIGTLAWNDHRHFETYFAVTGIGAVCHTINPRLFDEQIAYIVGDAADRILFVDPDFMPLVARIEPVLAASGVQAIIVFGDRAAAVMPQGIPVFGYEELLEGHADTLEWPVLDENSAALLCYTSGTTGMPKGVLYSHRATVLHAMAICQPDVFCLRAVDCVMPVVPMYHVNAWGLPFAAAMTGATLILPGPRPSAADLADLIERCGVSVSAAVPTVWLGLRDALRERKSAPLAGLRLISGGAACPVSLVQSLHDEFGVPVSHAWGMTELSPLGLFNARKPENAAMAQDVWLDHQRKQGRPLFLFDLRVIDAAGAAVPADGLTFGELQVRGPWVIERYYNAAESAVDDESWFSTGDIVTIDAGGYIEIVDRAKDVIKSGGEWISSIALENLAIGHPEITEAAVIAGRHPKWDERPLLIVTVRDPANPPSHAELLAWMKDKVASWWLPDATIAVDSLPHTATGKLLKTELKRLYGDHLLDS